MQETGVLSGLDARLVHALQISPRASWQTVAPVLDIDPVTAARRWSRLERSGLAWVTGYPGRRLLERLVTAFIEIDCRSGSVDAAARALADVPQVATVEHMAGGRDLLITVFVPGLGELSALLLGTIATLPGVTATRAGSPPALYGEGSWWRLRALTAARASSCGPPPRLRRAPVRAVSLDGPDWAAAARAVSGRPGERGHPGPGGRAEPPTESGAGSGGCSPITIWRCAVRWRAN
ncbi:Lrp/AsnC family transcriptional regulator [Streptomyces albulus]|nr:Lrp/AsnC family transcriptional regulator [Streptomyces noursei]